MTNQFISIEEIHSTLAQVRQDPNTKRKFPQELWDSIIHLTKTHSAAEICRLFNIHPSHLKRKMHHLQEQAIEFHEISIKTPPLSYETVTIELSTASGLQAKIQGPLSCLNCLYKLFEG